MKKENIIVSLIILATVVGYFIFLTVSQMQSEKNVFLSRQKVEFESLANPVEDKVLLRYRDREFKFRDLPLEVQQRIKNEQLASHKKTKLMLKDFLVRFHKAALMDKKKTVDEIKVEKLPYLSEIGDARVDEADVEKIYQLNKSNLPKDHDPVDIKQQIKLELLTNEGYKYILNLLTDIYKKADATLPSAPKVPEEWLLTEELSPHFGEPDAINHLIWISDYACSNCANYTTDLGLLLEKYSKKELRVTFIPWTENDIDNRAYVNVAAICLLKHSDQKTFWRFHSYAMTDNKELINSKRDNIKLAKEFVSKSLKEAKISQEVVEKVKACSADMSEDNKTLVELVKLKRKLRFIPEIKSPTLLLNGRLLDLEGVTLFKATDKELTFIMRDATR